MNIEQLKSTDGNVTLPAKRLLRLIDLVIITASTLDYDLRMTLSSDAAMALLESVPANQN